MTVTPLGNEEYTGTTSDTKPTNVPVGTRFRDDNNLTSYYDGSTYVEYQPVSLSTYIIYPVGNLNFRVKRGSDMKTVYTSNNPSTADALGAFNYVLGQAGNPSTGGTISEVMPGLYPISGSFTVTGGTNGRIKFRGPSDGSSLGVIADIRPTGNFDGFVLDGSTASINGVILEGLSFSHNTVGYSSALVRILNSAVENSFSKLSFYDNGQNTGDCFKFELTNLVTAKSQYSNSINKCIARGFDNFININNLPNTGTLGSFMSDLEVTNSKIWGTKRILNVAGNSGAECLDFKFLNCDYQYIAGNAVAAGQAIFNLDSSVSCWAMKHTDCQIWDITAPGINYMNVGSSCEVSLKGCTPTKLIAGSGISIARPKIWIEDWDSYRSPITEFDGELPATYTVTPIGTGILTGSTIIATATQNADGHGLYHTQSTGTTANTSVGYRKGPSIYRRDNNPYFLTKGSPSSTTLSRYYLGFANISPIPGSDTPLATTDTGFLIGFRGGIDTTYKLFFNNGGGSAMTVVDTLIPLSNSVENMIGLWADSSGYYYQIGTDQTGTIGSQTTGALPAASTGLIWHCIAQNNSTSSINYNYRWTRAKLRNAI